MSLVAVSVPVISINVTTGEPIALVVLSVPAISINVTIGDSFIDESLVSIPISHSDNDSQFPYAIWNGTSPSRSDLTIERSPDTYDWKQLVSEVIAMQRQLAKITDQDGNLISLPPSIRGANGIIIGLTWALITATARFAVPANPVNNIVLLTIPAGCTIFSYSLNIDETISLNPNATRLGLGDSNNALPRLYGNTRDNLKNSGIISNTDSFSTGNSPARFVLYPITNQNILSGSMQDGQISLEVIYLRGTGWASTLDGGEVDNLGA